MPVNVSMYQGRTFTLLFSGKLVSGDAALGLELRLIHFTFVLCSTRTVRVPPPDSVWFFRIRMCVGPGRLRVSQDRGHSQAPRKKKK